MDDGLPSRRPLQNQQRKRREAVHKTEFHGDGKIASVGRCTSSKKQRAQKK